MKKGSKVRILVADDHFVVRMGLAGSLNLEADMTVIAEATNGEQAVELYLRHRPDLTLMDLRLPRLNGIDATAAIIRACPEARVIVLSTYGGDEDIHRALQAGARAYLLKTASRDELLTAIRAVASGEHYLPADVAAKLASRVQRVDLSGREREVMHLIVKGRSNKEIASDLNISEVTVKLHVSSILWKLRVADRTQAVTRALERGIVHLETFCP